MEEWFGLTAAAIVLFGTVPAIIDVLKGQFKPSRSSWLMWSVLLLLTLLLQNDLNSGWAVWSTVADCISCFVLFGLSLRYGVGGLTITDKTCYAIWAVSIILWLTTSQPLLALHFAIIADTAAIAPIIIKTLIHPGQESIWPYITSAAGGLLAIAAVSQRSYAILLYPVYICAINVATVWFIAWRSAHKNSNLTEPPSL